MGLNGGHSYTHSISGVNLGELYQIALARSNANNQSAVPDDVIVNTPTIDIDASWIYRSSSAIIDNRMKWMINFVLEFVKIGFIAVLVCDNDVRHHSKRATIERKSKYEKTIIDGYIRRTELMKLAEQREKSNNVEEINLIIKQETALSKKIVTMDTQQQATSINVGEEFYNGIKQAIEDVTDAQKGNRNGNLLVIKAKFQADSVLAYRCKYGFSNVILCSDSDLAALAGNHCLGIKSYKYNDKKKGEKLVDMVLFTYLFHRRD